MILQYRNNVRTGFVPSHGLIVCQPQDDIVTPHKNIAMLHMSAQRH